MKNLLLLIIACFTFVYGHAQEIPVKANTITITFSDSNNVQEKVLKVLTGKDYPIKTKDKTLITTGPKTVKGETRVSLNAQLKGADVILTGKLSIAAQGSLPVEYKGNKGTPIMTAWEEMDKIAKAMGGKVKYEVK